MYQRLHCRPARSCGRRSMLLAELAAAIPGLPCVPLRRLLVCCGCLLHPWRQLLVVLERRLLGLHQRRLLRLLWRGLLSLHQWRLLRLLWRGPLRLLRR